MEWEERGKGVGQAMGDAQFRSLVKAGRNCIIPNPLFLDVALDERRGKKTPQILHIDHSWTRLQKSGTC